MHGVRFSGLLAVGAAFVATTVVGMPAADAGPRCNVVHWHQHRAEDHGHYHDWYYEDSFNNHGTLTRYYWMEPHNIRRSIACGSYSGSEGAMAQQLTWNSIDAVDPYQEVGLVSDVINLFQT